MLKSAKNSQTCANLASFDEAQLFCSYYVASPVCFQKTYGSKGPDYGQILT